MANLTCSVLGTTYIPMVPPAIHVGMSSKIHPHLVLLFSLVISHKGNSFLHLRLSHQCDEVKGYAVIVDRKLGCDCLK